MGSSSSKEESKINWLDTPHIVNANAHKIFCRYWEPSENPRALVFIAHGYAEHCGWYDHLGKTLADRGMLAFAHDHVGHGKSEGYPGYIDSFAEYTQDVVQHVQMMKEQHPGIPCLIIGHSMGGLIAMRTTQENPELFSAVALLAPLLVPNPDTASPFKVQLAKMVASMCPTLGVGSINNDWISHDKALNKSYQEDPLVYHGKMSARMAVCTLSALDDFMNHVTEVKVPLVNFHGTDDRLCELSGSQILQDKASSADKTLHVIDGAFHQVHNEPDGVGEKVRQDLVEWISSHA